MQTQRATLPLPVRYCLRALSPYLDHLNDTQLVFHFAKHEEIKRMASIMDITLLLERVRDAFLADRGSLLGTDGVLSSHFANEIDVTFRVRRP